MNYTVLLPTGARLTMLPPGISPGAETGPDCFRVARSGARRGARKEQQYGTAFALHPRHLRGAAFHLHLNFRGSKQKSVSEKARP